MGLIEIQDLYKIYNEGLESEVRALDGVSLSIDYGEFLAIVGSSGSGKSTMMNILGCLDVPTRGGVHPGRHPHRPPDRAGAGRHPEPEDQLHLSGL